MDTAKIKRAVDDVEEARERLNHDKQQLDHHRRWAETLEMTVAQDEAKLAKLEKELEIVMAREAKR